MDVSVYINELSLCGQFCGCETEAVRSLMERVGQLKSLINGKLTVYYQDGIWSKELCSGTHLKLSGLATMDRDLSACLTDMLDKGESIGTPSSASNYYCNNCKVNDSALSAAYDNQTNGKPTIVLSFPQSFCASNPLKVSSIQGEIEIKNITKEDHIAETATAFDVRETYDKKSNDYVEDQLTILADTTLFRLADIPRQHGRRVYERLDKKQFWYVDNKHRDGSAHLEVFDENGKHIGICGIDDINSFNPRKKEKGRTIGK